MKVPPAVGVPDSTPALDKLRPAGKAPALIAYAYGAKPFAALMLWLYAAPIAAPGTVAGATVKVGAPTVIVTVAGADVPLPLVAV
ncbi:hypothetical protein JAB6_01320 [Janthinobacterium sp. HH104]|nr:hypothetical protein JAB6_01320 [Janthinobacterium sp. HH104]